MTTRNGTLLWLIALLSAAWLAACDDDVRSSTTTDVMPEISERLCGDTECGETEVCCNFECVALEANADHCGACGNTCGASESCTDGVCACGVDVCGESALCCDAGGTPMCTRPEVDENNCGACGYACSDGERCSSGLCLCESALGEQGQCQDGEACCSSSGCVDFRTDPLNCGGCGLACGAGELCADGVCACGDTTGAAGATACGDGSSCCGTTPSCVAADDPLCVCGDTSCLAGQGCCDDVCISIATSRENCGACGVTCADGETCKGGTCVCENGLADCDGDAANGCETELASDTDHCGACAASCTAGDVCDGFGNCALNCEVGLTSCGGDCINLQTDHDHCGACGLACASGEVCAGGTCAASCQAGLSLCGEDCINLATHRNHCGFCGHQCASGEVCTQGFCALSCQNGTTDCGGGCVDTDSDRFHCGGCGITCGDGEVCNAGRCSVSCSRAQANCGGQCVTLASDERHCGACDSACAIGEECRSGSCERICAGGLTLCTNECVDLAVDQDHCGACGRACGAGEVCLAGRCSVECAPGLTRCAGICVDTQADRANCGGCGDVCGPGFTCSAGGCVRNCAATETDCNGCVNTETSPLHCGACDAACGPGEACSAGSCDCASGRADCNTDALDGCEINTDANAFHCGACDNACHPTEICTGGACTCNGSLADCNVDPVDGCETNTDSSILHCGACGQACALNEACSGGACVCAAGYADCNSDPADGCETDLWSDSTSCGTCGQACQAGEVCRAGGCVDRLVSTLSVGGTHSCLINSTTGDAECWGDNGEGQLGDGTLTPALDPVPVFGPVRATAVAVNHGESHSCAIDAVGAVICWGKASQGQLGNRAACGDGICFFEERIEGICNADCGQVPTATEEISNVPVRVSNLKGRAIQLALGANHTCALMESKTVMCWGFNNYGQLGTAAQTKFSVPPTEVSGLADVVQISAGRDHTCALTGDGSVVCFGRNDQGQIGTGKPSPWESPTAHKVEASVVAAGGNHTCFIGKSGDVFCFGNNRSGQLGHDQGDVYDPLAAIPLSLPNAVQVVTGEEHTCILSSRGEAWCVGLNTEGQCGLPASQRVLIPHRLDGIRVQELSAGVNTTCYRQFDDRVACVGSNSVGQLGVPALTSRPYPTQMLGVSDVIEVEAGALFTCVLHADRTVSCLGGVSQSTKTPSVFPNGLVAQKIVGLNNVVEMSAGYGHLCALIDNGTVKCLGYGNDGQLGDGNRRSSSIPVTVTGQKAPLDKVTAIASGHNHTCAVLLDRTMVCWGRNQEGQLGLMRETYFLGSPVAVPCESGNGFVRPREVLSITAGGNHTCYIEDNFGRTEAYCFGDGRQGQLGSEGSFGRVTENFSEVGFRVEGLADGEYFQTLSAGGAHTCGSTLNMFGQTKHYCWGSDEFGQLTAFGKTTATPTPVDLLGPAIELDAGQGNFIGVLNNRGSMGAWGEGTSGQLGRGTYTRINPPPPVFLQNNNIVDISVGRDHACFVTTLGEVYCQGSNRSAQVGDGAIPFSGQAVETITVVPPSTCVDPPLLDTCEDGRWVCSGDRVELFSRCVSNTCDALPFALDDDVQRIVEGRQACTVREDCLVVDPSVDCWQSCEMAIHKDFESAFDSDLLELDRAYCGDLDLGGRCGSESFCPFLEADCIDGMCVGMDIQF